jgi:hypothetical protein
MSYFRPSGHRSSSSPDAIATAFGRISFAKPSFLLFEAEPLCFAADFASRSRSSKSRRSRLRSRLPPPSRHIYNPLTIAVAFRRLLAFDRVWQDLIKVDGTFA